MKLLLVEDDSILADSVKESLHPEFIVDAVHTGEDGLYYALNFYYDLVLLDISLPDINGITISAEIRKKNTKLPILFLTGKTDVTVKAIAFVNGADDYLTKPFHKQELISRIRSIMRRVDQREFLDRMYINDIEINLEKRFVARHGEKIPLRQKDFQILSLLIRNRGQVMKRQDIQSYIWGEETELSDSTLDVHISYLREHFEKTVGMQLIKTVHGVGFMIE